VTDAHAKVNTVPSFRHPNDKKQRDFGPCLAIQASPSPDASDSRNNPVNRFCVKGSSGHVREISHHIRRVSPAAAVLQAAVLAAALDLCRKQEKDFPAGQPSRHRSASERDDRAGPPSQHMFSDIGALLTRSMRGSLQHVHPPDTTQAAARAAGRLRSPACQWIPGINSAAPMPRLTSPPGLGG